MVDSGEVAPTFTAPIVSDEIEQFDLEDALDTGPVVLAFFPGAFTSVCQSELSTFSDRIAAFEDLGVPVIGISRDSPFSLEAFREEYDLAVDLVSDLNGTITERYGVTMDFEDIGVEDLAKRAVFVIDDDGTVSYAWVSDDPGVEPDYDEVRDAAASAAGEE